MAFILFLRAFYVYCYLLAAGEIKLQPTAWNKTPFAMF
jgi:hypothetical protein